MSRNWTPSNEWTIKPERNHKKLPKLVPKSSLLSRSWPLWTSRHPLVTLSDATFGPLIPLDVTFEPWRALLGGPRPSRVVAPDQRESLRERKSDQTKQDDMIRRRNNKSIRRPLVGTRLCGSACQSCLLAILYHSGVADLVFLHIVEF